MKTILFKSISVLGLFVPTVALAFNLAGSSFAGVVGYILSILNVLTPILFAAAFIVFFWGLSKFILSGSGNQADLKKGKDYMMWGILILFILVSFRTIVSVVSKEFEIGDGSTVPQLPADGISNGVDYQQFNPSITP